MLKKRNIISIITIIILFSCSSINSADSSDYNSMLKKEYNLPHRHLKFYSFNKNKAVIERVTKIPDKILKYWKDIDEQDDYTPYMPTKQELKMIKNSIDNLPPLHKKIIKERLAGIYFVNNFLGSGLCDWVLDEKHNTYGIMIFNTKVLKNDISTWVSKKENTCFKKNIKDIRIKIDCGKKYSGFLYIMLHETTHLVDYIKFVSPFTEVFYNKLQKMLKVNIPDNREYVKGIWKDYKIPEKRYDFPLRKQITFYHMSGGPKIDISHSQEIYKQLENTPFVSLYGSMNWAEDLAEYVTFYHLTQKLKQPYKISIYTKDKLNYSYEPIKSTQIRRKFPFMELFY